MQLSQSLVFIAILVAFIGTAVAQHCQLTIEKASLRASSTHLRIRGDIVVGNEKCKPTEDDDNDVTTTITFTSKKNLSFKDAKNVPHAGNKCTITANWYNNPDTYSSSTKDTQVFVPFRLVTDVKCNKDPKPTTSTKKSKTTTKKRTTTKKTTTKKRTTTTKKRTTTTKKKTTTKKTTTKKAESSGGMHFSGTATFFTPNQGACGDWNDNDDLIAAVGGSLYGSYSKKSSLCNKKVKVTNKANGKSVTVTIKDACESCDKTHIDLSPGAFGKIGKFETGILKVDWSIQ